MAPTPLIFTCTYLFLQGQKVLEGKAGMAAALSVMGSSAVSLPALAQLPPSGASLQRLMDAADGHDTEPPRRAESHTGQPRLVLGFRLQGPGFRPKNA